MKGNKSILVTGGAGFIGSHLVDRLVNEGYTVTVIDNLSKGERNNVNPAAKFYKMDVLSPDIPNVFEKERPRLVFHYAAHIEARESVENPVSDAKINILGSINIFENCRKYRVKKIIFASSGGEIYGDAGQIPTTEAYKPNPISPYGVGKLTVENYLNYYFNLFNIPYISLRYGNVYGPRQNPNGEAGVIAIFTGMMLKNIQPLIHGKGTQTKDYIFIEDVIEANIKAINSGFIGYLNIGTGKETSVLQIFNKIKDLTNSSIKEKYIHFPICGFQRGCLSIKKAKKELNWRPKYDFNKGVEKTVTWFVDKYKSS
jgi:UDP-glucose 4-epimerase